MKTLIRIITAVAVLLAGARAYAQNSSITATLIDKSNGDPVGYATVSITRKGATKPLKYTLSSAEGEVKIDGVKAGTYTFKAELLGYETYSRDITVPANVKLGEIAMLVDRQQLEAASVSAVGNPIVIKKDTIEYNATSFKTTDNDVLEDLLKKLPGVEIGDDGSITVNGESIKKITIEGKTFFLDDPELASKNIPAKMVNKLKVIRKKSEQAEFTGIDDGEEENVIDLSVKPGMMKGMFGNVMLGGGHDVPSTDVQGDWRYQGAAFLGKFTDKTQISFLANGNNTNNRGFNDLSGSMMGNMRGGGGGMGRGMGRGGRGGNGITTSWMGGANAAWDLLGDQMDLGANYLYNHTNNFVTEDSYKETYLTEGRSLISDNRGSSTTNSGGHRFGMRLEHKFSENTSILFEPQFNFGTGNFNQNSEAVTYNDLATAANRVNSSVVQNTGVNKNFNASGFFLLRQRLGIPGRTLTAMARYSISNNNLDGINYSNTHYDQEDRDSLVNQSYVNKSNSYSVMGRVTYTEPLGSNLYLEANYAYNWSKNISDKQTIDLETGLPAYEFSNNIINESNNQTIGANLMYQKEKSRFQIGASLQPTKTTNNTTRYDYTTRKYTKLDPYVSNLLRWSPQAMVWWEFNENSNGRLFYRGNSSQPSISKLMPVPDNTDPLNVSFGNPSLKPYFSHNIRAEFRNNNRKTFSSFNISASGGFTQDPIVNAMWYGKNGAQYTMPFNGKNTANVGLNGFVNLPVGQSGFSFSNMANVNWNQSNSYVGTDIDMTTYDTKGYYDFMNEFIKNFNDPAYFAKHIAVNTTNTISVMERLRVTYRADNLELQASGRTRMNKSWYTVSTRADNTMTWSNQVRGSVNWTWEAIGMTLKSEVNYNWYNGYSTEQAPEFVMDAEIQKLLFKNKVTLALKGYDIFGQAKNLSVMDNDNYRSEVVNNTLGRYIVVSLTYRFGTFDRSKMRGPGGMRGGPGMGGGRGPR